jgi:mannose-1-phosphate guanylyltransferase/mannose-6-phosphate isomerase
MQLGGTSLFLQAVTRGQACGTEDVVVVTNQDYLFLTRAEMRHLDDAPDTHYLLEPKGRNTAPAIALAALQCAKAHGDDAVMMVLPADHLIPDTKAFVACATEAVNLAQKGQLVVFGVQPTSPDTGFGYIEVEHVSREAQRVLRFVEKPDLPTAQQYLATGRYYWNSGMFCFTAAAIIKALADNAPHALEAARRVFDAKQTTGDTTRFDAHAFGLLPDISIDYAVMEKAANVSVVPARFGWSDVGTHVQVESHGAKIVATVGVKDLVIVDTPDALLVAHKSVAQKVKLVVDALKARGHDSTQFPASVHRPWGTYATLKEEPGYKVKRITVTPGQSLSLQYHHQRAEHWVVVQGLALVQIGDKEYRTEPGQSRHIPVKEKHRLTNIGTEELVLIEVQCGSYLGEDDIVRLADTYGRV